MVFENKKVLVVGMKASGISAATLLSGLGANVYCYDDAIKKLSGFNFIGLPDDNMIKNFSLAVVSPSIPPKHPVILSAKKNGVRIIGELELGCMFLKCPQIMVTGTNGKTTVVSMIEKLLLLAGYKAKAAGNIGYPVSQLVLDGTNLDYAVIEVSSFQLEYASVKPDVSVILNLAPDHMDRYAQYDDYVATKRKICENQDETQYLIFNNDDGAAREFVRHTRAKSIPVSIGGKLSKVYIKDGFFMYQDKALCSVKCCKLRGEHNRFNMLVALNVGAILGIRSDIFPNLIKTYTLLPNRIEYVTTLDGKSYYNDSKGTNIHACRFAIESLDGNIGLIMGGSDKNEDFCEFFENINSKVKYIAVTGGNAEKIYNSAMKMGYGDIDIFDSLQDAVNYLSRKNNISNVLLSPCCASFDRYKNYAERGEKFKEAVYAIKIKNKD